MMSQPIILTFSLFLLLPAQTIAATFYSKLG